MCCFHVVKLVNKDLRAGWVNITLGLHSAASRERGCRTGSSHPKDPITVPHKWHKTDPNVTIPSRAQLPHPCSLPQPPQLVPNWEAELRACIKSQQCLCLQRQMLLQGMGRLSCTSIKAHKKAIVRKVAQNYVCSGNVARSTFKAACLILSSSIGNVVKGSNKSPASKLLLWCTRSHFIHSGILFALE